eukprot:TRINITY_DN3701_c3_g1_i1.p1 TRINITY_DN3701_c3_g1~~TRINITY_DN3701_c3_g1_i1.p1  ORF type:complete len:380 (+),score=54.75 TRINITY_DN3701_c3_g1_i1:70-1209(+)
MTRLLIATLWYMILPHVQSAPVEMDLKWLNMSRYPDAVCNDRTPAGFYHKAGTDSKKWLVHLMGGGWCWDLESCQERQKSAPSLMTSSHFATTVTKTGVFDDDEDLNPMATANMIYVPYCSSDGWMGDGTSDNYTFAGQKVIEAVLKTLSDQPYFMGSTPGETLLFSGCSAGGRGAMVNLDYIPQIVPQFPPSSITGMLDSALYINIQPYANVTSLANQTINVFTYANCTNRVVGSACGEKYSGQDSWKCLFGQYKMPTLQQRHVINAAQYDSYQMTVDEGSPLSQYTEAQKQYAENVLRKTMREVVLNNITNNIISTACFRHCTSESETFWSITTSNVSFSATLRSFVNNPLKGNKWVGNCTTGINCGPGCGPPEMPL